MHTGPVSILQGAGMAMHFACQHILERLCGYSRACQHISGFLTYTPAHPPAGGCNYVSLMAFFPSFAHKNTPPNSSAHSHGAHLRLHEEHIQ
jgi:hypothetical protein